MSCFYQIAKGNSPLYLNEIISFRPPQLRSSRILSRNNAQIFEPQCRTTCYQKSFFPHCIRVWNSLTNEIVNSASVSVFNSRLIQLPAFAHSKRSLDSLQYSKVLKGHTGRLVTQFRLGLSPLRNDLFTYNITDNPFCLSCGESLETLFHFLFECPLYSQQRSILLKDVTALITHVNQDLNVTLDIDRQDDLKHVLINGLNLPFVDVNYCINLAVFNIASTFISSTARFNQRI